MTWHSITSLITIACRTHVMYQSKRQGAVETPMHGAEFMVMKTAVEEVTVVRYMLRYANKTSNKEDGCCLGDWHEVLRQWGGDIVLL
eukprot:4804475-Ditylum_brightwellii.AAC.1